MRLFAIAVARQGGCGSWANVSHFLAAAEAMADGRPHDLSKCDLDEGHGYVASWLVQPDAVAVAYRVLQHYEPDIEDRETGPAQASLLRCIVGNPFRPAVVLPRDLVTVLKHGARNYRQDDVVLADWPTPTVVALAQAAYDLRGSNGLLDNHRLLVLADALEEAGCPPDVSEEVSVTAGSNCPVCGGKGWWRSGVHFDHMRKCLSCDARAWVPGEEYTCRRCVPHPLLAHMRSAGPHVPGCWAADLVLGRS